MAGIYTAIVAVSLSISGFAFADCGLPANEQEVARTRSGYTKFYNLALVPELLVAAHSPSKRMSSYLAWVRRNTSWSAREGLNNLLRIHERSSLASDPSFRISTNNLRLVASGRAGRIGRMNCIEAMVFEEFLNVADLRSFPSEAHAIVLRKGNSVVVLADYYARPLDQGSEASPASRREMKRLLKKNFRLWMLYHNHPFNFENQYGDIGGNLAPSEPDIALFQTQIPEVAVITNGIESVRLKPAAVAKFKLPLRSY